MGGLRLTEIWIYPIKSLGGIRLSSSPVLEKGLRFDRRWMLIDDQNTFMTQRICPQMALFKVNLEDSQIAVTHNQSTLRFPIQAPEGPLFTTRIWDDEVEVQTMGQEANSWFSQQLGITCSLVSFPEKNARPVEPKSGLYHEHVSLADAYPFLIVGEASLIDLNRRLKEPLPMNRFRPNFVFSGGSAFEEDEWKNFRIGSNRFLGTRTSSRCVMTTIDQGTAKMGSEPLATLAKYRRRDNKVHFGQNVIAIDHGEIFEGDEIILE